jgi:hypothetical protein
VGTSRLTFLIASFLLAGASLRAQAGPGALPRALKLGDYLRDDYVRGLIASRSPFRSSVYDSPQSAKVIRRDGESVLIAVFNFHEGGPDFVILPNGSLAVESDAGSDLSNLTFTILDSTRFRMGFDKFEPQTFIYVGNLDRYVAKFTVVGDYVDGRNRRYAFRADGTAVFPDREFKYSVGTDHVLNHFDYFEDETAHVTYGFKWHNGVLDLFRTHGAIGQDVDNTPFSTLRQCCGKR